MSAVRPVPGARSADKAVFLPGRNLLLFSKISLFCYLHSIERVAIGSLAGNPFPDSTKKFFRAFEKAFALALNRPLRILAPFRGKHKGDLLKIGKSLPLELTFSCLNPRGLRRCGRCNKCAERAKIASQTPGMR